jgi:peptidoglycan/xylan/chitin deacetylase (PgdA/CDA1 family)
MRREIFVVLYHHIAEHDDPLTSQLGLATRPDIFEKHIRYFAQNFDIVNGSDLISGNLPARPLLITFDDAYRSVLDIAGAVLKGANAPSVFFINPKTLAGVTLPIDNILSLAVEELGCERAISALNIANTGISSATRLISDIVPTLTQAQITEAKRLLCLEIGTTEAEIRKSSKLFLDTTDVTTLSSLRMEIGNHSMSHTFFRSLSPDELESEIVESRALLEKISGQPVPCLSIPYGNVLDATENALAAARRCGHRAIFLVHAKSNRFPPAPDIFYRASLGNTALEELPFKLRVMPMLRSLRDWVR